MRRLLAFLRQPYPLPDGPAAQLRRALLIGGFVGGFLLLFEPFGLNEWQIPLKTLKVAGFGLVSTLVTFGWYAGGLLLAPGFFHESRWNVARAALFLNLNILLIAIGNLLYLSWVAHVPLRQLQPGWMVGATFLLGLFPTAGVTLATYIRQLRHNQATAAALPSRAPQSEPPAALAAEPAPPAVAAAPPTATLTFTAENGKDTLTVAANALLYLEAADNYCTVVYGAAGESPVRALLRASLTRLAAQAAAQPPADGLTRVHRSYLVNLPRVTRVSGNAQGYRLHLPAPDTEPVPVGRTYAEAVLAALRTPAVRP